MSRYDHGAFENACRGKRKYATASAAHRVKGELEKRGQHVAVYRCRHCTQWHIGGQKR